jgi:hypothetical protein
MRVTVTGASGLIGPRLVARLRARGDEVTVLSRDPQRTLKKLQELTGPRSAHARAASETEQWGELCTLAWDLWSEPAPAEALSGRDAVVHMAGENLAQRWSDEAKRTIRESRTKGTSNLVQRIGELPEQERPRALLCSSGVGYYGPHGEEPIGEEAPPGNDFLADVCREWEQQAREAERFGMRVVRVRTGVVLDPQGGALAKMLLPFKLGIGGPVAGGRQFMSWIHLEDLTGIMLAAIDDERWEGPVNASSPEPVSNRDFSRALGRALHRPAVLPIPGFALQLLYGDMAELVTSGARVLPAKPLVLGYEFRFGKLDAALRDALRA